MSATDKPFRTGKSSAQRAQKEQSLLIQKQRQADELNLAEEESTIARKRALAKSGSGGRRSLIKTSEAGTKSTNLGGTV
jgi:hypothetical protein